MRWLKKAEALAVPVTYGSNGVGANVPIWFATGSAYLAAGNNSEAAARFERVVSSGARRAFTPMEYVRSRYFLGQINEKRAITTEPATTTASSSLTGRMATSIAITSPTRRRGAPDHSSG